MALIVLDSKDGASDFVVRGWIRATAQREHLHRETASVEEGSTSNPRGLALSLVSLSLRALTRSAYRRPGKPAQWRRDPSNLPRPATLARSEERRVGKECRSRPPPDPST